MSGAGRAPYVCTRACARAYVRARARTHAHNHIRINQHVRAVSFSPLFISYPCFPSPIFFVPLSPAHQTHPFVTTHTHTHTHLLYHTHPLFTHHTPLVYTTHTVLTFCRGLGTAMDLRAVPGDAMPFCSRFLSALHAHTYSPWSRCLRGLMRA